MNNKYIVSIEMIQDDECPIKGVINKIDDNFVFVSFFRICVNLCVIKGCRKTFNIFNTSFFGSISLIQTVSHQNHYNMFYPSFTFFHSLFHKKCERNRFPLIVFNNPWLAYIKLLFKHLFFMWFSCDLR